jgi:peptidyl-prolyl cis-trans isomerase SurA
MPSVRIVAEGGLTLPNPFLTVQRFVMKLLLALILGLTPMCLIAQSGSELPLNGIVARVNDSVITFKEVLTLIISDLEFLERRYGDQPEVFRQKASELKSNAIKELVERQLILHEFKTGGYSLPESWIEDQIAKDIRNYGNRLTLNKTLQAQGLTQENYRQKIRERVVITAMVDRYIPRDPIISPFKMESYYKQNQDKFKLEDQVKLRMIVITNRASDTLASKSMAQEILAKLGEGAPFGEMAKIYSHGSQSVEGGDWGWVERSVLRADLAEVAFSLKPGQRSGVVERSDGCYIMLVEDSKVAHTRPLSEVRAEIENTLKAEETRRLHDKWIDRLKAKSFVQYFPE